MGKGQRRYTDEERAAAVAMVEAAGHDAALAEVSRRLDIPRTTLHGWVHERHNPPPSTSRREKKLELDELLDREMRGILGEMGNKREDTSYSVLSIALGIVADKIMALRGQTTSRGELRIVFQRDDTTSVPQHLLPGPSPDHPGAE